MSLFIVIVLMSVIISNYNVQANRRRKLTTEYSNAKRLYELLRELQWNDDKQLSFETSKISSAFHEMFF